MKNLQHTFKRKQISRERTENFEKKKKIHTSEISIPKFGYEVGDGFCFTMQLDKKLKIIASRYKVKIWHVNDRSQLLFTDWESIEFVWVVVRMNGFKELKIKFEDPSVIYFFTKMKEKDIAKTGVELTDI